MSFNNIHISSNNRDMFSKLMSISVKECQQSLNSSVPILRKKSLKIEVESDSSHSTSFGGKQVMIRLSDENEPFFLYIIAINEQMFNKIKSSENLLIDFKSFAKRLIDLFETCFEEQNKDNPRFILTLKYINKELIILEVMETNPLKHLIHISLEIPAANEEFIKSNLSQTFRDLKLENERLENRLHSMEMQLNEKSSKVNELQVIESKYRLELREAELKYTKEIELQTHVINDVMDKESESKRLVQKLQNQLESDRDLIHINEKLESQLESQSQTIIELNNKMVSLEQQLSQIRDLLNTEKCERIKCEAFCEEKQKLFDESIQKNGLLTEDLSKANQIIGKLQKEVQSTHEKLSLLNHVASKQEQVVGLKQTTVAQLQSELRLCAQQIKVKDEQYDRLRDDFLSLRTKCDESEAKLNTNQNVISLLKKEITQLQLKHGIKSTAHSSQSTLPKVNLIDKQIRSESKSISQRNALFLGETAKSDHLFKR